MGELSCQDEVSSSKAIPLGLYWLCQAYSQFETTLYQGLRESLGSAWVSVTLVENSCGKR